MTDKHKGDYRKARGAIPRTEGMENPEVIIRRLRDTGIDSPLKISVYCVGVRCYVCKRQATHKVAEDIFDDDPYPDRHPYTNYLCCEHFIQIMGRCIHNVEGHNEEKG